MDGSVSCSVKLKLKPEFCRRHKSRNLVLFFFFVSFVLDNSSLDGEVQSHPLARSRVRQPFYRWGCFFSRRDTVFFEGGRSGEPMARQRASLSLRSRRSFPVTRCGSKILATIVLDIDIFF